MKHKRLFLAVAAILPTINVLAATKSFMFSKWIYALNLLKNFMGFQRMGDEMLFVNVNNLANTHSQCVMDTPKEGA